MQFRKNNGHVMCVSDDARQDWQTAMHLLSVAEIGDQRCHREVPVDSVQHRLLLLRGYQDRR